MGIKAASRRLFIRSLRSAKSHSIVIILGLFWARQHERLTKINEDQQHVCDSSLKTSGHLLMSGRVAAV